MMKIIAIVGPTGAGKSELAVKVAKRFGGEIICADSRQIYRWLDIGTGKVLGKWTPSPLPLPRLRGRVPRAQSR
ncbi:MAG: (d)CMP kinase, partial [Candidatus Doudnabacteria bacterium]|nr:(d)CMP kinase [Candidatus Doudnabacteria bacterium]